MDPRRVIGTYEDHLTIDLRLSPLTVQVYVPEISSLLQFCRSRKLEITALSTDQLIDYILERSSETDRATTRKILSSLRSFYGFLKDEGLREDDPARIIEIPRMSRHLPQVFTTGDVEDLLSCIGEETPLGLRDRTLFELIYSCGLRISEACGLDLSQVYLEESLIRVTGKRNRQRAVPVGKEAEQWIRRYLAEGRGKLLSAARPTDAVFISSRGSRLTRQGAWKKFRCYILKADLEGKIHTLRHSYATHMLRGGADLRVVQELLGHKDISTTQIYTHVTSGELQQSHRRFHPGGNR